jgi:hypothetical protein
MQKLLSATIILTLVLVSTSATAAVCVKVDEERDNLQPTEQQATKTMVENSLRDQDLSVASDNCTTTYTIYSLKLGNSVTANISGPEGSRTQKAHSLDELAETYDQLAAALISGEKEGQTAGVNRHNVTKKQAAPRRVRADSIYYTRLGYGAILGGDFASGPSVGFGWRYELDAMGIDISGINFILDTSEGDGFSFTLVRLGGMYFFDPVSNSTPYVSGALSWGWTLVNEEVEVDNGSSTFRNYSGNGLQGEVGVGYEFLRASTLRVFVEANAVFPFYSATRNFSSEEDSVYTPSFSLNIGLGYDPNPSTVVEVYD